MSQETERAKKLASDHWHGYVKPTLALHTKDQQLSYSSAEILALCEHHYLTAGYHFYLHALEDLRGGMFPMDPARYAAIHTSLSAEEVAAISEGVLDAH